MIILGLTIRQLPHAAGMFRQKSNSGNKIPWFLVSLVSSYTFQDDQTSVFVHRMSERTGSVLLNGWDSVWKGCMLLHCRHTRVHATLLNPS